MAALYGTLQGNRGKTTRCGSRTIYAELKTFRGLMRICLSREGEYIVNVATVNGAQNHTVCRGYLPGHVDPNATPVPQKPTRKRAARHAKVSRLFKDQEDLIVLMQE